MVKIYLLLLLTSHWLGAVYLQAKKRSAPLAALFYILPYTMLVLFLPVAFKPITVIFLLVLYLLNYTRKHFQFRNKWLQPVLLLVVLTCFSLWLSDQTTISDAIVWKAFFVSQTGELVKFLCLSVWLFKPANSVFRVAFDKYQYSAEQGPSSWPLLKTVPLTVEGAGAMIGNLERLMMAVFLSLNQYAAIGLILTAKSITRYNKITHDPAFSEYYLIGTLYSLLATLIPHVLIFHYV